MRGLARAAHGGLFLLSGTVVQALAAFGSNLVLARALAPEAFGRFAVVQAAAGLVLSVFSVRINILLNRTPDSQMTPERHDLLYSAMAIEALVAAISVLGWLLWSGTAGGWDLALAGSVVLGHWLNFDRGLIERRMLFGRVAAMETAANVSGHGLAVILVLAGAGAMALYVRELFALLALAAILKAMGGLSHRLPRWVSLAEWRGLLAETRGIWLDSMLEGSFQRLTVLTANAIGGQHGAGLLFQAQRLAVVPHQFLHPLCSRVMGTWFGQTEDESQRVRARRMLVMVLLPVLALAAVLDVTLADPVVPWLFGAQWAPAAPLLVLLAGVVVFLPLFELLRAYAVATRRVRFLLMARLAQYGGFALPLIPLAWGGADLADMGVALSLAFTLAFAVLALALGRHERI